MKLFTNRERRALLFLAGILLLGLLIREGREYLGLSSAADTEERARLAASFEEGYAKYLTTSEPGPGDAKHDGVKRRIDINHAELAELQQLSGIGPVLAKKIIDYRDKNGYFQTVQNLIKVKGIGPKLLLRWEGQLVALPDTNFRKGITIE
ncbi:ComEA family DNA-binding protein [Candidatus Neomarinimicrobiota bacterium]